MKKLSTIFLALIFALGMFSTAFADLTADEIITKFLENTGGIDNYKKLTSEQMTGKGFAQQMSFEITISKKAPNYYKMLWTSDMANIEIGCDGKRAWQLLPMVPGYIFSDEEDMPKMLEEYLMVPYLTYKERGAQAKLVGEAKVKGADAYDVEYINAVGDTSHLFFDKENFNIIKSVSSGAEVLLSKYQKVGDFLYPHKLTIFQGGQRILMVFNDVKVNIDIADDYFAAPADSLAAPPEVAAQIKQMMKAQEQQGQAEEKK